MSEGKSYNTAAIALFAVGGVAAATAITLFIVDFVTQAKGRAAKAGAVAARHLDRARLVCRSSGGL
jgi:hypothetical protein